MIDRSGPLPPGVYWRRRLAAVAMSIAAVVLLAFVIGRLVDGGPNPVQGASARSSQPPSARQGSEASSRPSASSSVAEPAPSTPATPATPATPPPPPPPPQPCPDTAIAVVAETDQPS